MYPLLHIFLDKIKFNSTELYNRLSKNKIEIMGVTKVMSGHPYYAKTLIESGITLFGDSRIQNIYRLRKGGINEKIYQIRSPMISESRLSVKYSDGAIITEYDVAKSLSLYARNFGKKYSIIVMVEMGDLREGVLKDRLLEFFNLIYKLPNLNVEGIAMNLGCYGGVKPTVKKLEEFLEIGKMLEEHGFNINILSGGATDTLILYEMGVLKGINQLRIGEAIALGRDTTNNRKIDYLRQDTFIVEGEIIEVDEKPTIPDGEIGRDAFGNIPKFEDIGIIKRAILAMGKHDVEFDALIPLEDVKILGGSGDHMILDIRNIKREIKVGDRIAFYPLYPSLLQLMESRYVKKVFHY